MTGLKVKLCKASVEDLTCDFVKYCSKNHVQRAETWIKVINLKRLARKTPPKNRHFARKRVVLFYQILGNLPF